MEESGEGLPFFTGSLKKGGILPMTCIYYFGASGEGGNHGDNDEMKLKEITWLFIDDNILNLKFIRSFTPHSIADC